MPRIPADILLFAHLACIALFAAGQVSYLAVIQPAAHRFFTVNEEVRYLQNVLGRQNPALLFTLCLAVLTGGFLIAPLKGELGAGYFNAIGSKLVYKLAMFFVVFFVSAYQSLSVGFALKHLDPAALPRDIEGDLAAIRARMTATSLTAAGLTAYIAWYAQGG